jgi:hypothetical protein
VHVGSSVSGGQKSARYAITVAYDVLPMTSGAVRACGGNDGRVHGETFSVITSRLPTIQEEAPNSKIETCLQRLTSYRYQCSRLIAGKGEYRSPK